MADDELVLDEGSGNAPDPQDTELIDGEDAVEEDNEEEAQASPTIEDYARARGWKPKEEWAGEGEWRSAEDFLSYGLDRAKDVTRDLKELRETTNRMADTQARVMQEQIERARNEERQRWQQIHQQAFEEGDAQTANQAVEKLVELNATSQQQQQRDPQVEEWINSHSWFNSDPVANAVAQVAAGQAAQNGASTQAQLDAAEKAVYQRFPEYNPDKPAKPIEVGKPAAQARPSRKTKTFHDLPQEAQQAARLLVERGIIPDTDGYVKQYFNKEGTVE